MSGVRRRLARMVAAVLVLLALVAVADRSRILIDLTDGDTLTLSSQTRDVVAAIDRDVEITAFVARDDPARVAAVTLLDRYRRLNRRIDVSVVDPGDVPGEVGRLGVDPVLGGVVLVTGDRMERAPTPGEGDVTAGIARLLREEDATVCVSAGHGERRIGAAGTDGLSGAAAVLERDGYVVREVDLLASPTVPDDCRVMVVAAPTGGFGDAAARSVARWVEDDGRLLLLTDPVVDFVPLESILEDHALGVERGVVLEGDSANVVGGDVTAPIVTRYPSASPVVRNLAPTFFPLVQEVVVQDGAFDDGLSTGRLAETSVTSYLEREPVGASFDPEVDRGGPIAVIGAADRSRVDGVDVRRTRIVVAGDVDFVSNGALEEAGNSQLLRQAIAWLSETEDLVAISPNLARDRPLRLTDERADYALVLSSGIVPGLFLLAGAMVWAVRRGR